MHQRLSETDKLQRGITGQASLLPECWKLSHPTELHKTALLLCSDERKYIAKRRCLAARLSGYEGPVEMLCPLTKARWSI